MTLVGAFAILLSIAAMSFAWTTYSTQRIMSCFLILIIHVVVTVFYYRYSLTAVSDAYGYYYTAALFTRGEIFNGTVAVAEATRFLKMNLGATYLDCFLVFQTFGFAGLMVMVRVFDEIGAATKIQDSRSYLALLCLPSVNFWTAAIGKDAPLFMAVALSVWAALKLRQRLLPLAIALTIMLFIRPHIALMAGLSFAGAAFLGSSVGLGRKLGLFVVGCLALWLAAGAVRSQFGFDPTSAVQVGDFLDRQNGIYARVSGTTSLGSASFPVRLFSLLFRPFFFDAHGLLGTIASLENVGAVATVIFLFLRRRDLMQLLRKVFFVRFAVLFAAILILTLTLVYYNVGLGLRQRVMAYPMIFSVLVALWSMRRVRGVQPAIQAPPLMAPVSGHKPAHEV